MTTTTCDLCGIVILPPKIVVQFANGQHPHIGEIMHTPADICPPCAAKLPTLTSPHTLVELRRTLGLMAQKSPAHPAPDRAPLATP